MKPPTRQHTRSGWVHIFAPGLSWMDHRFLKSLMQELVFFDDGSAARHAGFQGRTRCLGQVQSGWN